MKIARWKAPNLGENRQTMRALLRLGVPDSLLRNRKQGGFWHRRLNYLHLLELARDLWRVQIVYLHPDKPGGSHRRSIELNGLWHRVKRRFAQHGYELG